MSKLNVRDQLLGAGLKLFHANGFNATGVQELATLAGVPKGSFYNYFSSKDAFAVEVLDRYWQKGNTAMLSDLACGDARTRLRLYFEALVATHRGRDFQGGCLAGNFSTELSDQSRLIRDRLASFFAGWSRLIEGCIRDAQQEGTISSDLPAAQLASFVLNSWEGAVLRAKVDRDDVALTHFMTVIFQRVLC